jgi:alpha-tubulin suppressor-like RCC1 family protein
VGAMLTLAVKPQWVRYKLDKTIEQSCSDFLAHTLEVCKSAHQYNEYSAI